MGKRVRDRLRRVEARLVGGEEPVELRMVWADDEEAAPPGPGEVVIQLTWGDEDGRPVPGREADEDAER